MILNANDPKKIKKNKNWKQMFIKERKGSQRSLWNKQHIEKKTNNRGFSVQEFPPRVQSHRTIASSSLHHGGHSQVRPRWTYQACASTKWVRISDQELASWHWWLLVSLSSIFLLSFCIKFVLVTIRYCFYCRALTGFSFNGAANSEFITKSEVM